MLNRRPNASNAERPESQVMVKRSARLSAVSLRSVLLAVGCVAVACSSVDAGRLRSSAEPGSGSPAPVTRPPATDADRGVTDGPGADLEPPTIPFEVQAAEWRTCDLAQCADLEVPVDHANPSGPTITIAMTRIPARGAAGERIGSVFVNFGGPGGEGTETIMSFEPFIPDELRQRFDIVSWDPRGVEDTAGLGCDREIGDEPTVMVDGADGFDDELAADRVVWDRVMACVATSPIIDNIGTYNVALDLDLMRQAVGDDQLSYLGLSYGTEIGWVYASLFPENVRAMVLDGAVPPMGGLADQTFSQLIAIEASIDRYNQGCAQSPDCPLNDEGLESTILRLMDELEASPIPLDDGTTFGPVDLGNLMVSMTYLDQTDWGPTFAAAVASLDRGDVLPISNLVANFQGGAEEATFWAVLCADGSGVLPDGNYDELYRRALEFSPIVGRLPGGIFCDSFPGKIDGLPALDTTGTPPLLVIGNTGDNATPYADAVRLDQLLADSVLLTYDGAGHTITFFDECVDAIVVDYFIDVRVPAEGTRCGNPSPSADGWFVPIDN